MGDSCQGVCPGSGRILGLLSRKLTFSKLLGGSLGLRPFYFLLVLEQLIWRWGLEGRGFEKSIDLSKVPGLWDLGGMEMRLKAAAVASSQPGRSRGFLPMGAL